MSKRNTMTKKHTDHDLKILLLSANKHLTKLNDNKAETKLIPRKTHLFMMNNGVSCHYVSLLIQTEYLLSISVACSFAFVRRTFEHYCK